MLKLTHLTFWKYARAIAIALFILAIHAGKAPAQTIIDIFGPSIPRFPIAVFPFRPLGEAAETARLALEAHRILTQDLRISGFFELLDSSQALADPFRGGLEGRDVDWDVLRLMGADIAIGGQVEFKDAALRWEARLLDSPHRKMILGKAYKGSSQDLSIMVHRFADEIIAHYTGAPGIFQTQIAFLSKRSGVKELYLMDADGENLHPLTQDGSLTLSPRWSPDGREMAFISYSGPNAHLQSLNLDTRKRRALSARENMNGPAAWSPDGKQLALTLTLHGNPELYLIDLQGNILKRLTHHPSIDVSPTWSPDMRSIAFVSNRSGGPQVYIMDLASGQVRRLTYEGNYNTDPAWSPRGDRIAFSSLLEGNYEIGSIRPDGTNLLQLTTSPANDESPAWSPDGRYIAFSSTRSGPAQIFVMLHNGGNQIQITRVAGEQTSPAWSPWLKRP